MTMDPRTLTLEGWECFQRYFMLVNCWDKKLHDPQLQQGSMVPDSAKVYTLDLHLEGLSYLWGVAVDAPQYIADRARALLVHLHTHVADMDQVRGPPTAVTVGQLLDTARGCVMQGVFIMLRAVIGCMIVIKYMYCSSSADTRDGSAPFANARMQFVRSLHHAGCGCSALCVPGGVHQPPAGGLCIA